MTPITLDRDSNGIWTLTRPLHADSTLRLRLSIDAPGTPGDWQTFTAAIADSAGWLILGAFDIAPAELYPAGSPSADPEVARWNPDDEEDFQRISICRAEFAAMVTVWSQVLEVVLPASTMEERPRAETTRR